MAEPMDIDTTTRAQKIRVFITGNLITTEGDFDRRMVLPPAIPGQSVRVGDMVQAMTNVAGSNAAGLITWNEDKFIQKICEGWPQDMKTDKAIRLGFHQDKGFEDNIRWFLEDDIQR